MIKLLHVDDSPDDLEIVKYDLNSLSDDFEIDWAHSGEEALQKIQDQKYDCVLCDYQMPGGMNGFEVLSYLRENRISIPFILYTRLGNEKVITEALRVGADDYFSKDKGFAHYEKLIHRITGLVESRSWRVTKRLQKLSSVVDNIKALIYIVDADTNKFIFVNQECYSYFKVDKLLGTICDPDIIEGIPCNHVDLEAAISQADGTVIPENGSWKKHDDNSFLIYEKIIHWYDGRIARLKMLIPWHWLSASSEKDN